MSLFRTIAGQGFPFNKSKTVWKPIIFLEEGSYDIVPSVLTPKS